MTMIQLKCRREKAKHGKQRKNRLNARQRFTEDQVMSKVPALLASGGYIPFVDHAVPPDVSFENFCYYMELIKNLR